MSTMSRMAFEIMEANRNLSKRMPLHKRKRIVTEMIERETNSQLLNKDPNAALPDHEWYATQVGSVFTHHIQLYSRSTRK